MGYMNNADTVGTLWEYNIWDYDGHDGNVLLLPSKLGLKKPTASFTLKKTMESMNQPENDGDLGCALR